jgi:hypothetical protein
MLIPGETTFYTPHLHTVHLTCLQTLHGAVLNSASCPLRKVQIVWPC